jgi:hypothetical protein
MTASGRLINSRLVHGSSADVGKTVVIELPRGMRVIGTCKKCFYYAPKKLPTKKCTQLGVVATPLNDSGCGYYKAKK